MDNKEIAPNEFAEMLEGMTKQELVKFARMTYGLSVTAKLHKHDLIHAIKDAQGKFRMNDTLQIGDSVANQGLKPGYAEIQLHRTELTKGLPSVIVGLNGNMASLPIGSKFGCPLELVHILDNAMRVEYEQNPETGELDERPIHAYPFTQFAVNPHTPQSKAAAERSRGFRGRPPKDIREYDHA